MGLQLYSVPIFIGWCEAGAFWADFLRKPFGPLSERHGPVRGAVRGKRGVRVKREKPCEESGKHGNGNAGACT